MLECLVIGGGQSGLLCGYLLAQARVDYLVVDSGAAAGDVWRQRPASLRLFTSRQFCTLSDLMMPGDPDGYPSGREFADYLELFTRTKDVRVSFATRVMKLTHSPSGFDALLDNGETLQCRTVIDATGSNQAPIIPMFSRNLSSDVVQLSAGQFSNSEFMPHSSRIAVVGDGASGRQIAMSLAERHCVTLSCGRRRKLVANRVLGKDVFWWLDKLGILSARHDSWIAAALKKRDPIPVASASNSVLARLGVEIKGRAIGACQSELIFEDRNHVPIEAVVWCNGYRENTDWLELPRLKESVESAGHEGKTAQPGFFLMGRKWLTCRASELIFGANNDAPIIIKYVQAHLGK